MRILAAFLGLVLGGVSAQDRPTFSSGTLGVRVDVLVTEHNRPVAGLTKSDFEVRDNGVPQTIELVEATDVPVNAVLVLDTSASTKGQRLTDLVAASRTLVDGLKPADRVALTTFSHAVTPIAPLTADFVSVRFALGLIEPFGWTAVLDGIYVALGSLHTEPGRSLVVVCTDARDTASWLRIDELLEAAKRSNAVIYAVATGGARQWPALTNLTDTTGGRTLDVESSGDLRAEFRRILQEFRSRYVLTFTPSRVTPGGFHRLDVRVGRSGLTVKARPGYIGTAVKPQPSEGSQHRGRTP